MRLLAALFAVFTIACMPGAAQGPRTADGHPDLNGYWKGTKYTKPVGNIAKDLPGLKLPLTPAGEAAWKHNTTATVDPESLCILGGIPRHNASGLPFMVLQTPQYVAFLYFYSYYRLIPTDGRKHQEDPDPSFFGDEVGHWEGDALVIDSIGFKDTQVWADENGSPHSDALHVIERFRRLDHDRLELSVTIDDPKAYTKTFGATKVYRLTDAPMGETLCAYSEMKEFQENVVDKTQTPLKK